MITPKIEGVIARRLLVNYRVDPTAVASLVPAPFRPQLVNDYAVAGICLLRLEELRPAGVPKVLGRSSENAAHRVAVEWDTPDGVASGVYITRRDSDSLLHVLVGGRLFPGYHHRARFTVTDGSGEYRVGFCSRDGSASASVVARPATELKGSRLFADVATASRFFESGCVGYSDSATDGPCEGVELATDAWRVEPLEIDEVTSSVFDDVNLFSPSAVTLDSALLMRHVPVTWRVVGRVGTEEFVDAR